MAAAPAGTLGRWPDPDGRRQSVDDRGRGADGSARAPVGRFLAIAAALLLGVLAAALFLGMPVPSSALAGLTFTAAVGAFAVLMHRRHSHRRLGAANVVTLVRMAIAALLLGIVPAGGVALTVPPVAVVVGVGTLALALDGVDGLLARRQGTASSFGASFDMEVDAAFGLVLAILAMQGPAGPIALVLGLPRYLFAIAVVLLPWLNGPLDERYSRKVVCVVQLIALLALQLPFLPVPASLALVAATGLALAWSFGIDVRALWRRRITS
ncbi:CDP-alcohol phosphatidyltransferase [Microbacterium esteraromaticum]|nr:CDP-alcohol phosphatidyltransferase [Microbacterium esteraromaticum]